MALSIPDEFPLTEKFCYLTTAGMGLVPRSAIEATCELYRDHLKAVPYPDLFDEFAEVVEEARKVFAGWISAKAEEVSFQPNASTSLNVVTSMVGPKRGDNMVVDDLGFPSGTFPMIALGKKGVQTRWVKNREGLITAADYEKVIDDKTRLVVVSLVSWVNGLRAEVEEITKIAHEKGALCMVDSTHGTGYIDIDAAGWKLDFLATSNYKWLLSTHGSSEFFCASRLMDRFDPPQLGWHTAGGTQSLSAENLEVASTARKFEPGNPDYISTFTLTRSLAAISRFGRKRVTERTLKLSRAINEGLMKLGLEVLTPADAKHASGIVFARSKKVSGEEMGSRLRKTGILVTPRSYHGSSGIRVSPYFYNDEGDIETFLGGMKRVLRSV
ncbi:MAG: aminotransferase class V-fold PLP-dependent enzyme [Nitrososphaerota archaeon]|nr:aminotransferase class V-fold PLP-dependent enzyme [Nitrososphaerota archaeon]